MKTIILSLMLIIAQSTLTNRDIINLTKTGLGAEVIIAKIKTSKTTFHTSPEKLKELKEAGVADTVIMAMIGQFEEGAIPIPDGTPFETEVLETVSSETSTEGDPVTLKVTEDVKIDDTVVIKKGAIVKAVVAEASSSGRRGKAGVLRISLKYVIAVDGTKIKASATQSKQGTDKSAKSISLSSRGNIFGGMVSGEKAEIKAGRIIHAYTDEDKKVAIPIQSN